MTPGLVPCYPSEDPRCFAEWDFFDDKSLPVLMIVPSSKSGVTGSNVEKCLKRVIFRAVVRMSMLNAGVFIKAMEQIKVSGIKVCVHANFLLV